MGYPEEILRTIKERMDGKWILAFLSALMVGLLVHFYRLANFLLTWDSAYNFHASQNKPELGRVFLSLTCGIGSFYDLQWVNGLLSLFYLSLTSVCLVVIFDLQKKLTIVLTSLLVVSFPVVASTFAYMYTADGYFLGMLLFTLAVLLTIKNRRGFLPGIVLVAIGYGSYQAYIAYAVMLILVWSLLQLAHAERSLTEVFRYWRRFVLMGGLGTLLYLVAFKALIALQNTAASSYNGVSGMQLPDSFEKLTLAAWNCIIDFVYFFFGPLRKFSLYQVLNGILWMLLALLVVRIVTGKVKEKKRAEALFMLACVLAMPFACTMIYFVSVDVRYYMLMNGGFLLIYLLPVLWYDKARCGKLLAWAVTILSAMIIFNFALISNVAYLYMHTGNEKTFYLVNRMVDRIEGLERYENAKKLCMIGHFPDFDTIDYSIPPAMAGIRNSYLISEQAHFAAVMEDHFGLMLETVSEEEKKEIAESAEFKEMANWPSKESVLLRGDTVIIRIAEN